MKQFEISEAPVRCAKFIARKQWFVTVSDDTYVRVYNYNTSENITKFAAHQDYIRYICVHPTLPFVVTCSDDFTIRLWDWEKVCCWFLVNFRTLSL